MDSDGIIHELDNLYKEVENTHPWDVGPLGTEFNEFLTEAKNQYPDDESIQGIESAPTRSSPQLSGVGSEIRTQVRKLARELGADMSTFGKDRDTSPDSPEVVVNTLQLQSLSVDIDNIIQQVDDSQVQNAIEEFKTEVESTDSDVSRLKEIYQKVYGYSSAVAPQLFVYAAENGIDLLASELLG